MMNAKEEKYIITGIGSALCDFLIKLNDEKYIQVQQYLNAHPGGWVEFNSIKEIDKLLSVILETEICINKENIESLNNMEFKAGSSLLGTMSVFPREIRKRTRLITAIGDSSHILSILSNNIFTNTANKLQIHYDKSIVKGENPIGLIFISDHNSERLLSMYKGVSHDLSLEENNVNTEFLYVDVYELNGGSISFSIDKLIKSQKYKVILGLGNKYLLKDQILKKVQKYIMDGMIFCLSGNIDEYNALSPHIDYMHLRHNHMFDNVPFLLLTLGYKGLVGVFQEHIFFKKAIYTPYIMSTSGAGDAALGAFISGIIQNLPYDNILNDAIFFSSRILQRKSNVFEEGREFV